MSNQTTTTDSQQLLSRLARQGSEQISETSIVASPGAKTAAWAVKVKSHYSYNVYNVRAVVIGQPGSMPVEIGQEIQAVNLAESFINQGSLDVGRYVVISQVGEKNVFYAPVT